MGCLGGQRWGWATHGRHWAPEITCRRRLNLGYNGAGGRKLGRPAADPRERPEPQTGQPGARQPGPDYCGAGRRRAAMGREGTRR